MDVNELYKLMQMKQMQRAGALQPLLMQQKQLEYEDLLRKSQEAQKLNQFRQDNDYFAHGIAATNQSRATMMDDINQHLRQQNAPPSAYDYYRKLIEDHSSAPSAGGDDVFSIPLGDRTLVARKGADSWTRGDAILGDFVRGATPTSRLYNDPDLQGRIKEAETAASEGVKAVEKSFAEIGTAADKSRKLVGTLDNVLSLINTANVGPGANIVKTVQEVGDFFGVKIGKGLNEKQAVEALVNQLALLARSPEGPFGGLTGNTSDKDIDFLKAAVGQLGNTPEALRMIVGFMKAQAERTIGLHKTMGLVDTNNSRVWNNYINKYYDENPLPAFRQDNPTPPAAGEPQRVRIKLNRPE